MRNNKPKEEETKVTILIPTFNRSDYVQEAIQSSLDQTYPCHIIVCDHGSTDDTPEVMKKYKDRVQYVRREEDFGPHFCWLDGVLHCKTEFVKILFDDDWIEPSFVEKTLPLMKENVGCVISNAKIHYENGGKEENVRFFDKTGIFGNIILDAQLLPSSRVISPTACLFRKKELIDGIYQGGLPIKGGNYYHGVGPDIFVMLLCLLRYKKVGFVADYLATFRAHESSITIDAKNNSEKKKNIKKAYREVTEFYLFLKTFGAIKVLFLLPTRIIFKLLSNSSKFLHKYLK